MQNPTQGSFSVQPVKSPENPNTVDTLDTLDTLDTVDTVDTPNTRDTQDNPISQKFETQNVHQVYSLIAHHFSDTRIRYWKPVEDFIKSIPQYSVIGDIGCGNGKYSNAFREKNPTCVWIGSDFCFELLEFAPRNFSVQADMMSLPFKNNSFDSLLSIAVVHHLSTIERRKDAILEMIRVVKPKGLVFFSVWAFSVKNRLRHLNTDDPLEQDVYVPWHLRRSKAAQAEIDPNTIQKNHKTPVVNFCEKVDQGIEIERGGNFMSVYQRYYHLFQKQELLDLIGLCKGFVVVEKLEHHKDNWYITLRKL